MISESMVRNIYRKGHGSKIESIKHAMQSSWDNLYELILYEFMNYVKIMTHCGLLQYCIQNKLDKLCENIFDVRSGGSSAIQTALQPTGYSF